MNIHSTFQEHESVVCTPRTFGPCPVCGGSGRTLKSGHPFKTRNCWMCAGRMYFGPRWYEGGE